MNNYERIIAAIKHLDTDKVPMWFMGFFDESVMEKLLPEECIGDNTKSITARQEYLENCVVSIGRRANLNFGHGSPGEFLFKVTDENRDHRIMEFENGAVWKIEKCPCSRIYLHLPVEKREDLDALSLPNPRDPERYKGLKEQAYYYKKRGYFVSAAIMGFFSGLHYFFRSFDDVMADLILDPDFSHRLLNMLAEFNLACAEELLDCGVHAITLCDDLGSADNLLISPKHYREYFLPWHRRLADLCHSKGAYMHLHSHGNINAIMDLIVESGVDIINPLDPEENMNLEGLKKKYGQRITLCGGISRRFSSMSPSELQDHINSTIRCGAKGGGYIVMDASGIPDSMSKSEFNFYISTLKKYRIQKEKDIGS
jgi:uroporphyrinogen decarboxylase